MFTSGITIIPIYSDDNNILRKFIEIWDEINELIRKNNLKNFVELFQMMIIFYIEKNASAIRDKYRNDLVFAFTSVFNIMLQTSLVQYRY